jgi:hypothetical protein
MSSFDASPAEPGELSLGFSAGILIDEKHRVKLKIRELGIHALKPIF